jgi:hypothetical protein
MAYLPVYVTRLLDDVYASLSLFLRACRRCFFSILTACSGYVIEGGHVQLSQSDRTGRVLKWHIVDELCFQKVACRSSELVRESHGIWRTRQIFHEQFTLADDFLACYYGWCRSEQDGMTQQVE